MDLVPVFVSWVLVGLLYTAECRVIEHYAVLLLLLLLLYIYGCIQIVSINQSVFFVLFSVVTDHKTPQPV